MAKEKTNTEKPVKNWTKVAAIVQALIIWTAIVAGAGFFVGQNYANDKHESVKSEAQAIVSNLE